MSPGIDRRAFFCLLADLGIVQAASKVRGGSMEVEHILKLYNSIHFFQVALNVE